MSDNSTSKDESKRESRDEPSPQADLFNEPALNFDDDEIYSGRGNQARTGGTWEARGGDGGKSGRGGDKPRS